MIKKLYEKYESIILYIIFGVLTTIVSFAVQGFSSYILKTSVFISTTISWIAAVTFAYVTNRIYVFKSQEHGFSNVAKEAVKFYSARIITYFMEVIIMILCADKFSEFFINLFGLNKFDYQTGVLSKLKDATHLNEFIFKIIANVIILVSNYILSKLIVFKKK